MDVEALRLHLAMKTGAWEDYPFGPGALVYKVRRKMFALVIVGDEPPHVTLKCDPAEAAALREEFPAVQPSRYMHKAHWNTVTLDSTVPDDRFREMMDDSYFLVVAKLKKSERETLQ